MNLTLFSTFVSLLPLQRPSDTQDKRQQQTMKLVHWTPPNPRGHHIASNFSSRTTRISPRPPSFPVHSSIIPAPALSFSFPSSPPACIHHFIFPRAELGLARRMVFVPRPATLFYRGSSRLLLTRSLLLHDHERERQRGIV